MRCTNDYMLGLERIIQSSAWKKFCLLSFSNKHNLKWVTFWGKNSNGFLVDELFFQKLNSTSFTLDPVASCQSHPAWPHRPTDVPICSLICTCFLFPFYNATHRSSVNVPTHLLVLISFSIFTPWWASRFCQIFLFFCLLYSLFKNQTKIKQKQNKTLICSCSLKGLLFQYRGPNDSLLNRNSKFLPGCLHFYLLQHITITRNR